MHCSLVGGHVQRVTVGYMGASELALLQLRIPGETLYVIADARLGVGVIEAENARRIRHALARQHSGAQSLLRSRIEGARLVRATERCLEFERGGQRGRIDGYRGALRLDEDAAAQPVEPPPPSPDGAASVADDPAEAAGDPLGPIDEGAAELAILRRRGARIARELAEAGAYERRARLARALTKADKLLERRAQAVRADLARMATAQESASRARLFIGQAAQSPPGATELRAVDWSNGDPRTVEMPLDPATSAMRQIEALFKRARRLKDGARIGRCRLADTEQRQKALAALARALTAADPDLEAIEAAARAIAPRDVKVETTAPRVRHDPTRIRARSPFRSFTSRTGASILVGRGAAHNDELTFKIARPHHLWLHARGLAGAHVIVPLDKGASCPSEVLIDAAHIAAHFSDARGTAIVDVQYTPRRYVRKPRASVPGAVLVDREKVIVLRIDDEVLRALLAREAEPSD